MNDLTSLRSKDVSNTHENRHGHGHINRDVSSLNRHSAKDWLHNIVTIQKSTVLREIRSPVLTITAWSAFVAIAHKVMMSSTSKLCRTVAANMCVPAQAHSLLVSSLGLLLVFRTNSAYQRFVVSNKFLRFMNRRQIILCAHVSICVVVGPTGREKDLGANTRSS